MEKYPENPFAKTNRYAKLKEGVNKYRFFDFIDGWEFWTDTDGKRTPNRKKNLDEVPNANKGESKYFRAYRVWDYDSNSTKILSLTQRSLIEPLMNYTHDEDWGNHKDLSEFDITITRKGEGLETEYHVAPKPKTEFKGTLEDVNLKALYDNADPFQIDINFDEVMQDLDSA